MTEVTGLSIPAPARGKTSAAVWTGRAMSGVFVAFMLGASVTPKIFMPAVVADTMEPLGWPVKHVPLIAGIELVGTLLYANPRTAIIGAILLMGLFGGAIATHLRVDSPMLSHTLFSLYLAALMWGGLWLRDGRLRALILSERR